MKIRVVIEVFCPPMDGRGKLGFCWCSLEPISGYCCENALEPCIDLFVSK